jgi:hypothetical protein
VNSKTIAHGKPRCMGNKNFRCVNCKKNKPNPPEITSNVGNFCCEECRREYGIKETQKVLDKVRKNKAKKHRQAKRDLRLNDTSYRRKEAQKAFNAYIRERDKNEPCISCQKHREETKTMTGSNFDAGHYRSTGSSPELRFNELNCHKQCVNCNRYLSGNVANYRINLVKKIGLDKVEWLEGNHEPKRYRAADYLDIEKKYKLKLKELK